MVALISGPTGTGKTSCARVIAQELGARLVIVHAPAITNKGELCAVLVGLGAGDALFVDEVHALPVKARAAVVRVWHRRSSAPTVDRQCEFGGAS